MSDFDGLRRDRDAERRLFSWGSAAKHAGIATGVLLSASAVLAIITGPADPVRFGEGIGRLVFYTFLVGLWLSYLVQTRSWRGLAATGVLLVLLAAAAVPGLRSHTRRSAPELTAAERAPLELTAEGERRLRHPSLGYSFGVPPDLEPLPPSVVATMKLDPRLATTGWGNLAAGKFVLVSLIPLRTEAMLRDVMSGIREVEPGLTTQFGGAPVVPLHDEIVWSPGRREAHRHVSVASAHVRADAFVGEYGEGRSLAVLIWSFSTDGDALAGVAPSFLAR